MLALAVLLIVLGVVLIIFWHPLVGIILLVIGVILFVLPYVHRSPPP